MKKVHQSMNLGSLMIMSIIAFSLIMSSCSSGKKALEQGNYYESVMRSVNRLRQNPDHKKSRETLRIGYPLALNYYDTEVANLQARNDRNKWGGILNAYISVNNMYEGIRTSPGALQVIPNAKNYYDELALARENAAEESYQFGLAELTKGTREGGKTAYRAFQDVNSYVNGYKDVNQKLEEAYWAATLKVLIAPIPVTNARVQLSANFFEDKIHEELKTQPINEFVRFMTENELADMGMNADHVLELSFDEFTIGELSLVERQIDASRDSVKVGEATLTGYNSGRTSTTSNLTSGNTSVNTNVNNTNVNNNTSNTTNTNTTNTNTTNTNTTNTNTTNTNTNTTNTNTNTNTTNTSNNTTVNTNTGNTNTTGTSNTSTNTGATNTNTSTTDSGNTTDSGTTTTGGKTYSGKKVVVCFNNKSNTIAVEDLGESLARGASIFPCGTSKNKKVKICHVTGDGTNTLEVNVNALKGHLGHGDSLGGCDGSAYDSVKESGDKGNSGQKGNSGNQGNNNSSGDKGNSSDKGNQSTVDNGNSNETKSNSSEKKEVEKKSEDKAKDGEKKSEDKEGEKKSEDKKTEDKKTEKKKKGNNSPLILENLQPVASLRGDFLSDTTINVYTTVKAKVFIYEKTLRSTGTLDMKVFEGNTSSLLSADKFTGEHIWMSQWGFFNGDERALSEEQKRIVAQREQMPPDEQEMFIGFTSPIFQQLMYKLRNFYGRY